MKKTFYNKNVLITGGLGFIGSNLARRLVALGARVTVIDSLIPDYGGNLFNVEDIKDKIEINISDVRDQYSMNYLVKKRDFIFNLAGQVSHIDSMTDPNTDLEINCRSQLTLLEACRYDNPATKIIFASSRQVYGRASYLPIDEKHLISPVDVNGINKRAGEMYHLLYHQIYGIKAVCLRLTNTFGPGQLMKHNRQGVIPWFIRQVIDGEKIKLFGDGSQKRDINYVDDVVAAFLLAATCEKCTGQLLNLGGEIMSLAEFTKTLIKVNGRGQLALVPFPAEKKKIEIGDIYSDWSKMKKLTGWEPKVSVKDGLKKTIAYYRKNKKYYWE